MAKTCRSRPYLILGCPGLQECFQKRWFRCSYLGRGSPKTLRNPVLRGQSTCLGGGLGTLTSSQGYRTGLSFLICKLFRACQGGSKMPGRGEGRVESALRGARGQRPPCALAGSLQPWAGRGEPSPAVGDASRRGAGGGAGRRKGGGGGGGRRQPGRGRKQGPAPALAHESSSLLLFLLPPPPSSPPVDPGQRGSRTGESSQLGCLGTACPGWLDPLTGRGKWRGAGRGLSKQWVSCAVALCPQFSVKGSLNPSRPQDGLGAHARTRSHTLTPTTRFGKRVTSPIPPPRP